MLPSLLLLLPVVCLATPPGTSGSVPSNKNFRILGVNAPGTNPNEPNTVESYLSDFGYTSHKLNEQKQTPFELQMALLRFQLYHNVYRSGLFDDATEEKMSHFRCANADMQGGAALKAGLPHLSKKDLSMKFLLRRHIDVRAKDLWKKKVITWNVTGYPRSMSAAETREAIDEAFEKWRKVADFYFVETSNAKTADIVISFSDMKKKRHRTIVSEASGPGSPSLVLLDKNQVWSFRVHRAGTPNLFNTLLHSIGHTLGLQHVSEDSSIMYPLYRTSVVGGETLADVPLEDNIALRKLYGLSVPVNTQTSVNEPKRKCPKYLDSVTAVNDHTWFLFKNHNVYKISNGKITGDSMRIREVFRDGPDFVNATVTSNDLTLLFAERIIYGYTYDGLSFRTAQGFPRELHERVLFYPQAAFPLNNGSVVLLSGNVFATYIVSENIPSILNDKTRFFPNIPEDVRSGIPKTFHDFSEYYMFDETTVSDWNAITKQVASVQPITEFFKCA